VNLRKKEGVKDLGIKIKARASTRLLREQVEANTLLSEARARASTLLLQELVPDCHENNTELAPYCCKRNQEELATDYYEYNLLAILR
jgi:hypothetical protein